MSGETGTTGIVSPALPVLPAFLVLPAILVFPVLRVSPVLSVIPALSVFPVFLSFLPTLNNIRFLQSGKESPKQVLGPPDQNVQFRKFLL